MLLYALLPLQHLWSRLASFQVLSGHAWLLSTVMSGVALAAGLAHSWKAVPVDFSPQLVESWSYKKSYQLALLILLSASPHGVFANFRVFFSLKKSLFGG